MDNECPECGEQMISEECEVCESAEDLVDELDNLFYRAFGSGIRETARPKILKIAREVAKGE